MKRNFFYYFGLVMGLVYIAVGILILLFSSESRLLADKPPLMRNVLGALLIAYGLYRLAKQQYQQRKDDYNDQILDDEERA